MPGPGKYRARPDRRRRDPMNLSTPGYASACVATVVTSEPCVIDVEFTAPPVALSKDSATIDGNEADELSRISERVYRFGWGDIQNLAAGLTWTPTAFDDFGPNLVPLHARLWLLEA